MYLTFESLWARLYYSIGNENLVSCTWLAVVSKICCNDKQNLSPLIIQCKEISQKTVYFPLRWHSAAGLNVFLLPLQWVRTYHPQETELHSLQHLEVWYSGILLGCIKWKYPPPTGFLDNKSSNCPCPWFIQKWDVLSPKFLGTVPCLNWKLWYKSEIQNQVMVVVLNF